MYLPHVFQMGESLSPTPATTAEEALATSQEVGAVGGPAREGEGAVGGVEAGRDAEAWAAALPPVSLVLCNSFKCLVIPLKLHFSLQRIYIKVSLLAWACRYNLIS